jgi:hypothetical protein
MAVWKAVFLHEFLDGDPGNFRAIPGQLTVSPGGPVITPTPDREHRGFAVSPGHSLGFQLAQPANDVIGIDLSVDLLFPLQPGVQNFPVISLGGGAVVFSMGHLEFIDPGFTPATGRCRVALSVAGHSMELNPIIVRHRFTTRFRVQWHTHGQAQIWHDGAMKAYDAGFAANASVNIDRLLVGGISGAPTAPAPRFLARRVYLKVLRRDDARDALDHLVAIDTRTLPRTDAAVQMRKLQAEILSRIRKFMAETVLRLTTSWREGQATGPFSPESVAAHAAALAAAKGLVDYLAKREKAAGDAFLARIGDFLNILAAADPPRYKALLDELTALSESLDPTVRTTLQPLYDANAQTLEPLVTLLRSAWDRAKAAG